MLPFVNFLALTNFNSLARNSATAQYVYENVIWRDDVRIGFVEKSNADLPALSHCAEEIELISAAPGSDFDLSIPQARQIVGRMVSISLEPLGYTPVRKARMPLQRNLRFFKTAHVYNYTGNATQLIERNIVDI